MPDLYLTLSLGLEFEGFHYKLIAAVILPKDSKSVVSKYTEERENNWFDEYEQELARLLDLKKDIDDQIITLRKELIQQMEVHGEEKVNSTRFTISYSPPKTIMQFNSKLFREENQELFVKYCKPIQKAASIVVRRNNYEE